MRSSRPFRRRKRRRQSQSSAPQCRPRDEGCSSRQLSKGRLRLICSAANAISRASSLGQSPYKIFIKPSSHLKVKTRWIRPCHMRLQIFVLKHLEK